MVLGTGALGRRVAATLADSRVTLRLIDARPGAAAALAAILPPGVAEAGPVVDAADRHALTALVADAALLIDLTGSGALAHVAAAVCDRADVAYVAVGEEPLDPAVAPRGRVPLVVGAGISPGVTGVLGLDVARALDVVDDVTTGWRIDDGGAAGVEPSVEDLETAGEPSAAAVGLLRALADDAEPVVDGAVASCPGLSPVAMRFAACRGTGWLMASPEPSALQELTGARNAATALLAEPPTIALLIDVVTHLRSGRLGLHAAAAAAVHPSLWRTVRAGLTVGRLPAPGDLPPLFATATGRRDGRELRVGARMSGPVAPLAAWGAAACVAATRHVLSGDARNGVQRVEELVSLDDLLWALPRDGAVRHVERFEEAVAGAAGDGLQTIAGGRGRRG